jgi:hypothetical protein
MNYYPEHLKAIIAYCEALNAAEQVIGKIEGGSMPYPKRVPMTNEDETDWGELVDEIGGAWSWRPAKETADG